MANAPKFANASVSAEADVLGALFDLGKFRVYDGAKPAAADDGIGGATLLAELTLPADCFPAAVNGLLTANPITGDSAANATGTATWFRALTAGLATIMDGTIGEGAGFDAIIDSDAIQLDADVNVTTFTLQVSKG